MKMNNIQKVLTIAIATGSLILISGCQTPGKVVSTDACEVCPQCETQTVTAAIKGLTYTKHVCPLCKTVETDESKTSTAMASYTSMDVETIHVCEQCKSVVTPCPQCAAK